MYNRKENIRNFHAKVYELFGVDENEYFYEQLDKLIEFVYNISYKDGKTENERQ